MRSLVQLAIPLLILMIVGYVMTRRHRHPDGADNGAGFTLLGIMFIGAATAVALGWIAYVFLAA